MAMNIPDTDIWSFLFERTHTPFPEEHIIFQSPTSSSEKSYKDIRFTAEKFGTNLQSRWSWKKGDVLVIVSPNSTETPALIWGCQWAGGVVSPANPAYTADELRYHLVDSEARGIVVHHLLAEVTKAAARQASIPESRILVIYDDREDAARNLDSVKRMTESLRPDCVRPKVKSTDLAFLVYSSGTTGLPKGGMIAHSNVVSSMVMQSHVEEHHLSWQSDRLLALLPTYHIYGLVCLVHLPIYLGLRTLVMEKFTMTGFLNHVQDYSVTHAYVAPPVVLYLSKLPQSQQSSLSSLRMLTSGGAPLGEELIKAVYQRLNIPVRQAFGLTESTAISHIQRWDKWITSIGSNGPPLPGLEIKFVDENDQLVFEREGEMCMRGPTIFKGYYKNQKATESCLGSDGWFRTGDIGYQDKDGNLFITDRLKDLIKFKGYQIAPAEIESILHGHPHVDDVAIISTFSDHVASEIPLAYVVLKSAREATTKMARDLIEYASERTAPYKRLTGGIIWIDQIPKSPSGKILKRVLKERVTTIDKGKAIGAVDFANIRTVRSKL